MQLYNANLSPNALRVRAVVYELGIPVEKIDVDLRNGGNRVPEFLKLNSNGKVPVLVDGDVVIWESRAINALSRRQVPGEEPLSGRPQAARHDRPSGPTAGDPSRARMQRVAFERVHKPLFGRGRPTRRRLPAN